MIKGANISKDRLYRYALWRIWDRSKPHVVFIGVNPSTADETKDDHTITKCIGFAKKWNYGGLYMLNLFAFRATDPNDMKKAVDPIGKNNYKTFIRHAMPPNLVVAAWGNNGKFKDQDKELFSFLRNIDIELYCLGTNTNGTPCHPLMISYSTALAPFNMS